METELTVFERKLGELVDLCHRLRVDNQRLRKELAASRDEASQFRERIDGATAQLEKLIERMPDQVP
jgi:cell division protein ZapB